MSSTQALRTRWWAAALLAATWLGGCAVTPARLALPEALAGAEALPFDGLNFGRSGSFSIDGQPVRFERGADRFSVFGALSFDRAALSFELAPDTAAAVRASCKARRVEVQRGIVAGALRPFGFTCDMAGATNGRLDISEARSGAGTRAERSGRFSSGGIVLDLRSIHALAGSPLPLETAAGYLLLHDGRPVAALDLTDMRPVLRRLPGPTAAAATQAALALALLWDPAAMAAR